MRLLPFKTGEHQASLSTHLARSLLVRQRPILANALRAHRAELGFVSQPGIANLAKLTDQGLANKDAFPSYASAAVEILIRQIMGVSSQIAVLDQQQIGRAHV